MKIKERLNSEISDGLSILVGHFNMQYRIKKVCKLSKFGDKVSLHTIINFHMHKVQKKYLCVNVTRRLPYFTIYIGRLFHIYSFFMSRKKGGFYA